MAHGLDSEGDRMSDTIKRVLRTLLISFVGLYIPAIIGFLGELTKWAGAHGQTPFPELSSLGYAGVAAIAASLISILNLVVNLVEDATGKTLPGFLSRPLVPKGAEVPTVIPGHSVKEAPASQTPDRDTRPPAW